MYPIVVIAVAPTDKASFVYNYVQTRLGGQYNGKYKIRQRLLTCRIIVIL